MIDRRRSAAVLLLGTLALAGCKPAGTSAAGGSGDSPVAHEQTTVEPTDTATDQVGTAPATPKPARTTSGGSTRSTSKSTRSASTKSPSPAGSPTTSGPRIVSFRVVQKPKCAEGTAVFRAKAVDLIIAWKITGATGGALSVDDNTNTPGTYGQVASEGQESFGFSCAGPVGTVETHSYAIYSVGGGPQQVKKLKVSAKVLDKGVNNG